MAFPRNPKRRSASTRGIRRSRCAWMAGVRSPHVPQGLALCGYGSSMMMTASVGLFAAALAVERLVATQASLRRESQRRRGHERRDKFS